MGEILVIGDIHLDDKWVQDTDEVLDFIVEYVRRKNISYVVLLGDIYHRRDVQKGSQEEKRFHKFLKNISQHSVVKVLVGNHDVADSRLLLEELSDNSISIDNIYLIKDFNTLMVEDMPFRAVFMPWQVHHRLDAKEWLKSQIELLKEIKEEFILFGHISFAEAFVNKPSKVSKNLPSVYVVEDIDNYRAGFFGDIHQPQMVGDKTWYVGAIRNITFGESGRRRMMSIVYDSKEFVFKEIPLPNRETYNVEVDYDALLSMSNKNIKQYANGIVKLKINCKKDQYVDPALFEQKWLPIVHKLEFVCDYESKVEFKNLDIADDIRMFEAYCNQHTQVVSNELLERIKFIGRQIIEG